MFCIAAFCFIAFLFATECSNAEPADDFLFGLRERGWHDTVLEYLDSAAQDPLTSSSFRQKIAYERAVTQSALARLGTSEKLRQQALVEAAEAFQQFAESQPDAPLQIDALASAGSLFTELALFANNKAAKLPEAARKQREQLYTTARDFLDRARQPLTTLQQQCISKLESLPKAAELQKSQGTSGNRQQLEGKLAEAKFLLAKLDFEKALTYAEDSKSREQATKSAVAAFAKLYEEYEDKLVGFYGRFYQGRSFQVAGDFEEALKCYLDIVDQPPIANQDFRRLVSRAYRYRAECHIASKDFDKAIEECRGWLDESRGSELSEPDWLAVSYLLAEAYEAQAKAGVDSQRLEGEARKLYREIAKHPGEYQRDAKTKITSGNTAREKPAQVETFEQAFSAGKEALELMSSAKLAAKLAADNNPGSVESLTTEAETERMAAIEYLQQATRLADGLTDVDDLATARYFLCGMYWEEGRLEEAAVIGEFLARRYPENKYAPLAAKIALAAYERLYNSANSAKESTDFEARHLAEVAELLVQRWPSSPEAEAGLNLLINIALRDNRLADAEQILERLPAASRAGAELRLGRTLWTRYQQAMSESPPEADSATLDLKRKAGKLLANGFQALESSPRVNANEAVGVLYYAQFLLAAGQAEQAVAALENSSIGPLSLIEQKSNAAQRPEFVQEVYKVGLRAYVSAEPPHREKAQEMMAALEASIGNQPDAERKLINIYVNLGLQLQQQISSLTADGQADKARAVASSFADLLARVTERAGAADNWGVQKWIAQTNLQLGQGLRGNDAQEYFQRAEKAYQALLAKAEKTPKFAPSAVSVLATKKQLADCQLAQGKHSDAFQQYALILKSKPNMLELQIAAAAALQEWGVEKKEAKRLEEAILGAMPQANRKNLVWGWLRIAALVDQSMRKAEKKAATDPKQAARVAKYLDLFFEAKYRAAEARFAAGKLASGAARTKQMNTARQSLESMKVLYPDLGGPKWHDAYVKLIKQMEQEQ